MDDDDAVVERLIQFENCVAHLFREKKIRVPIHLSGSKDRTYEHWLVNYFKKIQPEDYVFCTWRNHMHYLLKGGDEQALLDEILGKPSGICKGYGGSMHIIDVKRNFYSSAIVGGVYGIAVGVAAALQRRQEKATVYCFGGDGATDSPYFVNCVRYVCGHNLPMKIITEDNDRSVCTSKKDRWGSLFPRFDKHHDYVSFEASWPHAGVGEFIPL